jgi:hypothetical protein
MIAPEAGPSPGAPRATIRRCSDEDTDALAEIPRLPFVGFLERQRAGLPNVGRTEIPASPVIVWNGEFYAGRRFDRRARALRHNDHVRVSLEHEGWHVESLSTDDDRAADARHRGDGPSDWR